MPSKKPFVPEPRILMSGPAAVGTAAMGLRGGRMRGDKDALWWAASTIILAIPVVALLILA
jgi:hypothetical protein